MSASALVAFLLSTSIIPERDSKDTMPGTSIALVDVTKGPENVAIEPTDGFSSLKTVLGIASAVHAKVCLEHAVHSCSTNPSVGEHYPQEQD